MRIRRRFRLAHEVTSTPLVCAIKSIPPDHFDTLSWSADNRYFVVEILLPRLNLPNDVRQVVRWAYGYDGEQSSYERRSNGSSCVPDNFMGSIIKEPAGVGHDYLFSKRGYTLPNGERWGWWKCNWWYLRAQWHFGYPLRAVVRFLGLTILSYPVWLRLLKTP